MNNKRVKGLWFFGMSGSGKTYLSKILKNKIKNSVLVDGDVVRKYVSFDLGYSLKDREHQILRVLGIGKIISLAKKFPIISTVYFNKKLLKLCKKEDFYVLQIVRKNKKMIKRNNATYKSKKNIVGVDISYEKFKKDVLINNETKNFWRKNKILDAL